MIGADFHGGGHPWHGLCTLGSLSLPNATAKTYPQPSGGDCFKLAVPGFTPPVRTAAQQADDTAQGLQWLDHVLVSGDASTATGLQVYGKPLGKMKWLYSFGVGKNFKVDASGLTIVGTALAGTLVLTEFGKHDPDGQLPPTYSFTIAQTLPQAGMTVTLLMSLSTDGSQAILGFSATGRTQENGIGYNPHAFCVLRMTLGNDGVQPAAPVFDTIFLGDGAVRFLDAVYASGQLFSLRLSEEGGSGLSNGDREGYFDVVRGDGSPALARFDYKVTSSTAVSNPVTTTYAFEAPTPETVNLICPDFPSDTSKDYPVAVPDIGALIDADLIDLQAYVDAYFGTIINGGCTYWVENPPPSASPRFSVDTQWTTKPSGFYVVTTFSDGTTDATPTRTEARKIYCDLTSINTDCSNPQPVTYLLGSREIAHYRVTTQTSSTGSSVVYKWPYLRPSGTGCPTYGSHYYTLRGKGSFNGDLSLRYIVTYDISALLDGVYVLLSRIATPPIVVLGGDASCTTEWRHDRIVIKVSAYSGGAWVITDAVHVFFRRLCQNLLLLGLRVINGQQTAQPQYVISHLPNQGTPTTVNAWDDGVNKLEDCYGTSQPHTLAYVVDPVNPVAYV